MAHELFPLLKFLETFGGDNFRHNGVVHQVYKYADVLKKFMREELAIVETAALEITDLTKTNVENALQEANAPDAELAKLDAEHKDDRFIPDVKDVAKDLVSTNTPDQSTPKPEAPQNVILEKGQGA